MKDKVALVTGASRGIGRAIALELARRGAHIAVHYHRSQSEAERLVAEIEALSRKALVVQADLGARDLPEDFVATIERALGKVDLLVCNAGVCHEDMAAYASLDDWDETIAVNLRGALIAAQAFLPQMLRQKQGSIVLVSSEAGQYGSPGMGAYAASKAGLVGFAQSLAAEVGRRGVRVNVVSPGLIETDLLAEMPQEKREAIAERTALGRLGQPEEVAEAVRFLLSDEARYITGSVLTVNGGLRML